MTRASARSSCYALAAAIATNGYNNERSLSGTVVSFDRRDGVLVLQTEGGRMINVDLQSYDGRLHRGDRVSVSGRMDRDRATFVAAGVRVDNR